jgi:hypothetical protein
LLLALQLLLHHQTGQQQQRQQLWRQTSLHQPSLPVLLFLPDQSLLPLLLLLVLM